MDVSVVIPAYKATQTLSRQLKALSTQITSIKYEVIVSDNCKNCTLQNMVQKIAENYPVPLKFIESYERLGAAHARNKGVSYAQGNIIAFCDSDDYVAPTWIQAAWEAMQTGADIAGGEIRIPRPTENTIEKSYTLSSSSFARKNFFGHSVSTCNLITLKDSFIKIGGFDESLPTYGVEDFEFCIRASLDNQKFINQPELNIYFSETKNKLKLINKIFKTGIGRTVVWHHYRQYYGDAYKIKNNIAQLAGWLAHGINNAKELGGRKYINGLIARCGAIYGSIYYYFAGWPAPKYFDK